MNSPTNQPAAGPIAFVAAKLVDAVLRAVSDQIRDAIPAAPADLRPGYEGALRAVLDEMGRRRSAEASDRVIARRIVDAVLRNLDDRSGFDGWWGDLDTDIQAEIRRALRGDVEDILRNAR